MTGNYDITELLETIGAGDESALDHLFAHVYDRLHQIAHGQRKRWRGEETLNTTVLIHEAYLKLSSADPQRWENRGHFFAVAARLMRQTLVDRARYSGADKRGGDLQRESLDSVELPEMTPQLSATLLSLDQALERLQQLDLRQARVVECRFFAGLSVNETAEAVGASTATVERDWRAARLWLFDQLATSPQEA